MLTTRVNTGVTGGVSGERCVLVRILECYGLVQTQREDAIKPPAGFDL